MRKVTELKIKVKDQTKNTAVSSFDNAEIDECDLHV